MVAHSPDLLCCHYTLAGVSPASGVASPRPFKSRVRACAEAGYAGIGLHLRDYHALRREGMTDQDLAAILRDGGMRHVELEFLRNWFADGAAGEAARRDELTFYRIAEALGARAVCLGGAMMGDARASWDQLVERFALVCERARDHGVRIAVEPCIGTSLETVDQGLRLIRSAGARNAGLCLDVWHLYRGGLDYQSLRRIDAGLIVGVQLGDAGRSVTGTLLEDCLDHRLLPGDGAADVEAFVAVLLDMGVAAPFGVEVVSIAQRERPLSEAAEISYRCARAVVDAALKRRSAPGG
jgi:sugar phosphate isomerase/epimerase